MAADPFPKTNPTPSRLLNSLHRVASVWGTVVVHGITTLGDISLFAFQMFGWMIRARPKRETLMPNFYAVGVLSLPVVALTGTFIGMVLAIQSYHQFKNIGLETRLGAVINMSLVRELGPVLAATMLAGRVGSAMAAVLGTMRVTEQIDALVSMGANPIHYLVVPRFLACVLLIPALTVMADFMGIVGGYFYSVIVLGIDHAQYLRNSREFVGGFDLFTGVFKSVFFGATIAIVSCYRGFHCQPGAEGVGRCHCGICSELCDDFGFGHRSQHLFGCCLFRDLANGGKTVLMDESILSQMTASKPSANRPILETKGMSLHFGRQVVLDDISIQVNSGETVAIIGESGCGKTMFLKALVGLLNPTSGSVIFDGKDIQKLSDRDMTALRKRFGFVFQNAALFDSMTISQNIAFPLSQHGVPKGKKAIDLVSERLSEVGLPNNVLPKRPSQLSGGMRKRVGLARALILEPDLLLYDEPTTGLDPIMSDVINELMMRTRKRYPVTSIIVTHDMHSARKVADRIIMLYPYSRLERGESQILFDGPPAALDSTRDKRVKQFVNGEAGERLMEMLASRSKGHPDTLNLVHPSPDGEANEE